MLLLNVHRTYSIFDFRELSLLCKGWLCDNHSVFITDGRFFGALDLRYSRSTAVTMQRSDRFTIIVRHNAVAFMLRLSSHFWGERFLCFYCLQSDSKFA